MPKRDYPMRSRWTRTTNGRLSSNVEKRWSDMLPEILEHISNFLPLLDFINFRQVCRSWRSSPSNLNDITKFSKTEPWFMVYGLTDDEDCKCYLYDASYPKCCTILLPDLQGAKCVESKSGWLLAQRDDHVFFCNPFLLKKINLPKYQNRKTNDQLYTFLSLPTSDDCIVIAIQCVDSAKMEISFCYVGDQKWETKMINISGTPFNRAKFIYGCNCRGYNRCDCQLKDTIFIRDSLKLLSYNFVTQEVVFKPIIARNRSADFYKRLRTLHCADWLCRSRTKDVILSICQLKFLRDDILGIPDIEYSITSGNEMADQPKILKAVWLEPCFKDHEVCPSLLSN
ncbi:uncharacterized protein [Typha angustifolia]|uniref:uncharacterized protein n=1 Tax=Typha angustifolia TaxID=59011 RepID=UPI003C30A944